MFHRTTIRESLIQHLLRLDPSLSRSTLEPLDHFHLSRMLTQHKRTPRRYQAKVVLDGKRVSLGYYKTPGDAKAACDAARFAHSIGIPYNVR